MSGTKHTPGPWTSDWDDNGFFWIDPIHASLSGCPGDDAEANARLIAAAPELLEACKAAEESIVCFMAESKLSADSGAGAILAEIRAAMNKAEGR